MALAIDQKSAKPVGAPRSIYGETLYKPLKSFDPEDQQTLMELGHIYHLYDKVYEINIASEKKTYQEMNRLANNTHDYKLPPRKNMDTHLKVHIVPHSHDDVGWLKTVDEYFTGVDAGRSHASVDLILTEVVEQLLLDPKKRFTYVEMKYFTMWYKK